MIEHTPDAWYAIRPDGNCTRWLIGRDRLGAPVGVLPKHLDDGSPYFIAVFGDLMPPEQARGNAHLIATACAAPHECSDPQCPGNVNWRKLELFDELLAAFKVFTDEVSTSHRALGPHRCEDVRPVCPDIDAARAAIVKATE